jgi:hypothetical protein
MAKKNLHVKKSSLQIPDYHPPLYIPNPNLMNLSAPYHMSSGMVPSLPFGSYYPDMFTPTPPPAHPFSMLPPGDGYHKVKDPKAAQLDLDHSDNVRITYEMIIKSL